jgi:hypothetical protein
LRSYSIFVQLGSNPRTKIQFGPKLNTKVAFNTTTTITTTHPPKTFGLTKQIIVEKIEFELRLS